MTLLSPLAILDAAVAEQAIHSDPVHVNWIDLLWEPLDEAVREADIDEYDTSLWEDDDELRLPDDATDSTVDADDEESDDATERAVDADDEPDDATERAVDADEYEES
jgi:hypothetical protein